MVAAVLVLMLSIGMSGGASAQDEVEGPDEIDGTDEIDAGDEVNDRRELGSDPHFTIAMMSLASGQDTILRRHPRASVSELPFDLPTGLSLRDVPTVREVIVRFAYRDLVLTNEPGTSGQKWFPPESVFMTEGTAIDLRAELRFTGRGDAFALTLEVITEQTDCTALATALQSRFGEPAINGSNGVQVWRSLAVGQKETLEVRCRNAFGYQVRLTDVAKFERFIAEVEGEVEGKLQRLRGFPF